MSYRRGGRVQRLMGYWSWSESDQVLVRDDGASLRYLGPDDNGADPRYCWFRFLIRCDEGETPLLVQHRLAGFDAQYRTLYWRGDFTRGDAPSSHAQWAAFERIAADGLACWPERTFGEVPDYIAIQGGWSDGGFCSDGYAIYERVRIERFRFEGRLPEPQRSERRWRFHSLNPAIDAPTAAELVGTRYVRDIRDGLARMIDRGPALVCEDRAILLEEDEYKRLHATYIDEDFVSDRYVISGLYRTQEDRWAVGDYASVVIGARRLSDFRAAERNAPTGLLGLFWKEPRRRRKMEEWPADPLLVERAGQSFAEALFEIPAGAFSSERASAPPLLVALTQGAFQGGYLQQRVKVARSLGTDEFVAGFAEEIPAAAKIPVKPGVEFDAERARLAFGGRALAFERALDSAKPTILLRCIDGELSWPVVVEQSRHHYHQLRSWSIDHEASLAHWRDQSRGDLPDAEQWDCMRQFVEDALLSWPDCAATGYAPQQLLATGGYYDGAWRGPELLRILERPYRFYEFPPGQDASDKVYKPERDPVTGPWSDYRSQQRWQRTDRLPVDLAERNYGDYSYVYSGGSSEEPIPFTKRQVDGTGELAASVFNVTMHREEAHRVDYADFSDGERRLRVRGVRSSLSIGSCWPLAAESVREGKWRPPSAPLMPLDLATWRSLRDAAESGLRGGEKVTVTGVWIFERFFGATTRKTELLRQLLA